MSIEKTSRNQNLETTLRELREEVSSLRWEIRGIADSLISNRLKSVERAIVQNHLEIYAVQAGEFLEEEVERCLRRECGRRLHCHDAFKEPLRGVLEACKEMGLEGALADLEEELNDVEDAIEKAADTPCESCYQELRKLLYNQRENLRRIACLETDGEGEETELEIDVSRIVEDVLKPLSHPARLTILSTVYRGRTGFSELSQSTGMIGGHLIFHLDQLLSAGMIVQDGKKGDYVITQRGVEIINKLRSL